MHNGYPPAHEKRGTPGGTPKLRVGLVMPTSELQTWQWTMLEELSRSSYAEIAVVVMPGPGGADSSASLDGTGRDGMAGLLSSLYAVLDSRFHCEYDALATKDAAPLLANVPTIAMTPYAGAGTAPPGDLQQLSAFELDVLLPLCPLRAARGLRSAARYGAWAVYVGDRHLGYGTPPGFWEVYFRSHVTESGVEIFSAEAEEPQTVYRSYSYTEDISVRLNKNNVYWKSLFFLPRLLEQLHELGPSAFFSRLDAPSELPAVDHPPRGEPNAMNVAVQILQTLMRRFGNLAERVLRTRPWILLFHFGDRMALSMSAFRKLVPPRGLEWADPFVVFRDEKHYVFFEEYVRSTSKGHLSVFTLEPDGRHSRPEIVLERPYHLSYPFVFDHAGSLYMVPESMANRTVELYRCTGFPLQWELVENLLENVYAVDSTLLFHRGKWWLFANVTDHPGASTWEELCVYHSDSLIGGRWTPHLLNPVVSDVRRSRPAGALFVERGQLYRPSQDCSVRYGYAIKINHITELSEKNYEEHEVASIEPHWDRALKATHTLNHAGRLTVIDAMQPRFRP